MENKYFKNTLKDMETAIEKLMSVDFDMCNIDCYKEIFKSFEDFPETLFIIVEQFIIANINLSRKDKIQLLEYIDSDKNDSLNIKLSNSLLLNKLDIYCDEKEFDKILPNYEKYNFLNDINNFGNKEAFFVLYYRVLTKKHKYSEIIKTFEDNKINIKQFKFTNAQENIFYNYVARAYAHIYEHKGQNEYKSKAQLYLDIVEKITPDENATLRNYRYKAICYWLFSDNRNCIKITKEGIKYIEDSMEIDNNKKYYSDLNRLCAAASININNIKQAEKHSKIAYQVIEGIDYYYYEKFWIEFQMCSIYRKNKEYDEGLKKIKEIRENENYKSTIENHPESKYKLRTEEIKNYLAANKQKNIKNAITTLRDPSYKILTIININKELNRYLLFSEAYYKIKKDELAKEYLYASKIMFIENDKKLNSNFKRVKKLVNEKK